MAYQSPVCRGSYALGTACGLCEKCLEQKKQYQSAKSVRETLDGTAALKATIARLTAELTAANQRAAASVEAVARANAERDDIKRAKECFQRTTLAHWQALCAMRNTINEYIPMPNTDSGPLFSPEDGPIYADIAERVVARLKADREYVLAINQELKDRTQKAEAERDALVAAAYDTSGFYISRAIDSITSGEFDMSDPRIEALTNATLEAAQAAAQAHADAAWLASIPLGELVGGV